jgi:hypothetical protein
VKLSIGLILLTLALGADVALQAQTCPSSGLPQRPDWPVYGGRPEGDHYSGLSQINRGNVGRLKEAWKFDSAEEGGLETSPIVYQDLIIVGGRNPETYPSPPGDIRAFDHASSGIYYGLGNKTEGIISKAIAIPPQSTDVFPSFPAPIFVTANSLS